MCQLMKARVERAAYVVWAAVATRTRIELMAAIYSIAGVGLCYFVRLRNELAVSIAFAVRTFC